MMLHSLVILNLQNLIFKGLILILSIQLGIISTLLDFDEFNNFVIQMSANLTLTNNPTGNRNIGQSGLIVFHQDGTDQ